MKTKIALVLLTLGSAFSQADAVARANLEKPMKGAEDILLVKLPPITRLEKTQLRCGDYFISDSKEFSDGVSKGSSVSMEIQVPGSSGVVGLNLKSLKSKFSPQVTSEPIAPRVKFSGIRVDSQKRCW